MTTTDVKFSDAAREKLLKGADILARAVKATLGPKGRNVLIKKGFGSARISKDGVTVAKSVELADHMESELAGGRLADLADQQRSDLLDVIADFCANQNPHFNRARWLGYIAGTCGPNGGAR